MPNIFISHSNKNGDDELARKFRDIILARGKGNFSVTIAEDRPRSTQAFPYKIADLIDECDIFIPLITNHVVTDNIIWVHEEFGYAYSCKRKFDIKIIPVVQDRSIIEKGFINYSTDIPFSLSSDKNSTWKALFEEVVNYMLYELPEPFILELNNVEGTHVQTGHPDLYSKLTILFFIENTSRLTQKDLNLGIVLPPNLKITQVPFKGLPAIPRRLRDYIDGNAVIYIERYIEISSYNYGHHIVELEVVQGSVEWKDSEDIRFGIYLISSKGLELWSPCITKSNGKIYFNDPFPNPLPLDKSKKMKIRFNTNPNG